MLITHSNLLKAYYSCRKHKRQTINGLKFEYHLEQNILALLESLQNRTYQPMRSMCFIVNDPKIREIFAASFADRVVHHLLVDQIEPHWEKHVFIDDTYACRKGRGHHFGVRRVWKMVQSNRYYGQFDISNFFANIDKTILYHLIQAEISLIPKPHLWKDEVLYLTNAIVFNDPTCNYVYKGDLSLKQLLPKGKSLFEQPPNTGLPIGNLTSQFFANVYLNELDQFVINTLQIKDYARYMDDFVLFANSQSTITQARNQIIGFLRQHLRLELNPRKQKIQPCCHGLAFVGYYLKPGSIYSRRNVVKTVKKRLHAQKQIAQHSTSSKLDYSKQLNKICASLNSYYGHFGKAQTFTLRQHLYHCHLPQSLRQQIIPANQNYSHLKIKPVFSSHQSSAQSRSNSHQFVTPAPKKLTVTQPRI